jgi:YVTN family beta-propeller protein
MSRLPAFAICAALAGCALVSQPPSRPALDSEGEVQLRSQPLGADAAGIVFELASAAAERSDGSLEPLRIAGPIEPGREQLVAEGALPPGLYSGFALVVRKASRSGRALVPPAEPLRVDAPFSVASRRATVLSLRFRFPPSAGDAFAPESIASQPPKTLLQPSGYCTSSGSNDLEIFDTTTLRATAAVPTGRAPWGVALDTVANRAYVALSGEDQVAVVDLASSTELFRIRLGAGDGPRELVLTPDRRLLVSANAGSSTLSFIDPAAMVETARLQVGDEPSFLLLDRKSPRLYVFNQRGSSVSVVDLGSRTVVATLPIGTAPLRGQMDAKGSRLYVASPASADLMVYALPQLTPLQRVHVGLGTTALRVDSNTDLLYVANADRRVSIFDPFSMAPFDFFDLPGAASFLSIDAGQDALFALLPQSRSVVAVQLTTKAVSSRFDVGPEPRVLALFRERN